MEFDVFHLTSMSERIWLFQYLVVSGEMDSLIQAVDGWTTNLRESGGSFETMKNCLFAHTFRIDCAKLRNFSEELFDVYVNDYHLFKGLVHTFMLRIIKRIVCDIAHREIVKLDLQQLRLCYEPVNFPSEMAVEERNGIVTVGSHCYFEGKVSYIGDLQPLVIRSFFRCRNAHCGCSFYLKPKECFGAVHCRRCGELAAEDETGRIFVMTRHITVIKEGNMGLGPVNVLLKGPMCEYQFKLGQKISVFGILSYQTNDFFRINATRIAKTISSSQCTPMDPTFSDLLTFLNGVVSDVFCPVQRIVFSVACVAAIFRSVLIQVRTVDDMKLLIDILQAVFRERMKILFPSKGFLSGKDFPSMLSCDDGIVLIPHLNILSPVIQQKFVRTITEMSVCGYKLTCGVVGISVSPTLGPLHDTPFESFHGMVRLESIPRPIMQEWIFGKTPKVGSENIMLRTDSAKHLLETIDVNDDADLIITQYIGYCTRENDSIETEFFVEMAFALAAFRNSPHVTPFDVYMAIYFFEERQACLHGSDSFLSQLPSKYSFFTPSVSSIPVTDESSLFQSWVNYVTKTISS